MARFNDLNLDINFDPLFADAKDPNEPASIEHFNPRLPTSQSRNYYEAGLGTLCGTVEAL
jgi:hypothetical protein